MNEPAISRVISFTEAREELKQAGIRIKLNRYALARAGIRDILLQIEDVRIQDGLVRMYDDIWQDYNKVCAGAAWHHTWVGGLADHVREMVGWCLDQRELYPQDWQAVSVDDIIVGCFLHDLPKTWYYTQLTDEDKAKAEAKGKPYLHGQMFHGTPSRRNKLLPDEFIVTQMLAKYHVEITDEQLSAVIFAEGGYSDYVTGFASKPTYTGDYVLHNNPLAVMIHMADLWSSQIVGGGLKK